MATLGVQGHESRVGSPSRAHWTINSPEAPDAWLVCDGRRVGPVSVAASSLERSHGLLGRDSVDGALLLQPAFVVHSFGMRFPIDVAFCDRHLRVISVITMPPRRLTRPRLRTWAVVEAQAGAFGRWRLSTGSRLAVEPDNSVEVGEPD
jgi:uncharacterized protein